MGRKTVWSAWHGPQSTVCLEGCAVSPIPGAAGREPPGPLAGCDAEGRTTCWSLSRGRHSTPGPEVSPVALQEGRGGRQGTGEEWGDQGRVEGQTRDGGGMRGSGEGGEADEGWGGGEEQTRGGVGGGVTDYESRAQRMVDLS